MGDRAYAQFRYYKLWPCKITRVIRIKDGGCNSQVTYYGSDEVKIVTSEIIWRYLTKHADALKDGLKNVQRAIKLCMEDSDGLPNDLSDSVLSTQRDQLTLREGIEDEIRKQVDNGFAKLDTVSPQQFRNEFLDTITQAVYKATELQFQSKFDQIEKGLNDLKCKITQNGAKIQKLETKPDDFCQTSLLNKIIVSGIETTARDLPTLSEKVLDRLNVHMGLHFNNTMLKTVRRLGSFDQSQVPIELTFVSEVTSVKILRNRKKAQRFAYFSQRGPHQRKAGNFQTSAQQNRQEERVDHERSYLCVKVACKIFRVNRLVMN